MIPERGESDINRESPKCEDPENVRKLICMTVTSLAKGALMDRRKRSVWIVVVILSLGLLLGACGDDDGGDGTDNAAGEGNLEAFCDAAESIGAAGAEPDPEVMRGFADDLATNAPPEIRDDAVILANWFNEIIDKYGDDPDAQLSEEDISEEVQAAQVSFQAYIEENCPQFQPTPAE